MCYVYRFQSIAASLFPADDHDMLAGSVIRDGFRAGAQLYLSLPAVWGCGAFG
jgi:hypothetical protein